MKTENMVIYNFLKEQAKEKKYEVVPSVQYGNLLFNKNSGKYVIKDLRTQVGYVYGIAVLLTDVQKKELYKEASDKKTVNPDIKGIDDFKCIPGSDGLYPIYWGRDAKLNHRIEAHMKGHKNGNIKLPSYDSLKEINAIHYGCVHVDNYVEFEKRLLVEFPCLIGRGVSGKVKK